MIVDGSFQLNQTGYPQIGLSLSINCWMYCFLFSFFFTAVHVLDTGTKIKLQQSIALALDLLYLWLVGCHTQRCALPMKSLELLRGSGKCWLVSNHWWWGHDFCLKNSAFKRFCLFLLEIFSPWQGHLISWLQPASLMIWRVWTKFLILIVR